MALHTVAGQDFYEGVRAVVIDKDQAPQWRPPALAEVSDEMVARYFEPVEDPISNLRQNPRARGHDMATIGFIGLGNMGAPMARNLVAAGHEAARFDCPRGCDGASRGGRCDRRGRPRRGGAPAPRRSSRCCRPASRCARSISDRTASIAGAAPGTLLIDCSTIDVETARAVACGGGRGRASQMLDAPVSGGVAGAEAATLTFMVGGERRGLRRAPSRSCARWARTVIHAGGPGNGQAAKICNNMILGISMIARVRGVRPGRAARAAGADPVRHQQQLVGPVLVDDLLLPGAGAGAELAGQPRLPARLHRRHDAEGPAAGAASGRPTRPRRPWRSAMRRPAFTISMSAAVTEVSISPALSSYFRNPPMAARKNSYLRQRKIKNTEVNVTKLHRFQREFCCEKGLS